MVTITKKDLVEIIENELENILKEAPNWAGPSPEQQRQSRRALRRRKVRRYKNNCLAAGRVAKRGKDGSPNGDPAKFWAKCVFIKDFDVKKLTEDLTKVGLMLNMGQGDDRAESCSWDLVEAICNFQKLTHGRPVQGLEWFSRVMVAEGLPNKLNVYGKW